MPESFHRRGHHVQKAHGRRRQFAADGSHLSGGMIALMPTAADAKRLALPGGEAAADLHCTLLFLGDDGAAWPPEVRDVMEETARALAAGLTPVKAKIFGVAHWNAGSDNPSWVWSTGDDPDRGLADSCLSEMRDAVGDILGMTMAVAHDDMPEIPEQHSPWAAHICAAYTDDLTLVRALEKRNGPVVFDRIRLSFGDDDRDIPLLGQAVSLTASARDPHEHEQHTDFAEHDRQWQGAVTATGNRLALVMNDWRKSLREQIAAGLDTPEELATLSLDPEPAVGLLDEAMQSLAQRAGEALQREAQKQGVEIPDWSLPDDTVTAAVGGRRLLRSVAQTTAGLLSTGLVQSAKRIALNLLTRQADPQQLAAEVDNALQADQERAMRGPVGTAMSTAQTAGRQAVLEAAPPGEYYASEILDKNTCTPCKAVDGEQFSSLEIAIKAYPVMGYKDCVGSKYGNPCRGMIVARWAPEPEAVVAHGSPDDPGYPALHPNSKAGKSTQAERTAAMHRYTGQGYEEMNTWLRARDEGYDTSQDVKDSVQALEDMIRDQPPTTSGNLLWRGINHTFEYNEGDEFEDPGFTSLTSDLRTAESFAQDADSTILSISVPKGSHILDVAGAGGEKSEKEFVLPPGTRFRVTSISYDDEFDEETINVEVIHE